MHVFVLRGGLHWPYGGQSLERLKSGRGEGDHSFTLRTKRTGNHPGERNSRPEREAGGGLPKKTVHKCAQRNLNSITAARFLANTAYET